MRSVLAILRSLTLPFGAGPGTPRIVIGPDVPAALQNLSRSGIYPTKWQTSGASSIVAAILYYDALNAGDDFFWVGVTGPLISTNGYLLTGWSDGTAANANVYVFHEVNPDSSQRQFVGGLYLTDMDSPDARRAQGFANVANGVYYGANDGLSGDQFSPFRVSEYWAVGNAGWGAGPAPFSASLPLGMVQTGLGARRLVLTGSTGTTVAESVVNTWQDNLGNTGITTTTWPVFKGRSYRFRGLFTMQSTIGTDIVSVKVRQQAGGAPNLITDPILATLGGDGRALDWHLDQPYEPTADALLKAYVTMTRAGGTGSISLFGDGRKSHLCLEDLGISAS